MFYTKYRPKKFSDLFGQDHIVKTLSEAIKQDKIVHGYLFCGPRGTGKTTVARILAKSINCIGNGDKPCGKCQSCRNIEAGKSVDIIEIDAASNRGIDEMRDLRERVKFAPTQSKYKVYIIDEVHMLTKEAFNALLKTLEEPPAHVVFIFATTESHKVLATIVSRCQRYGFHRADINSSIQLLQKVSKEEKIDADLDALALIARAGDGAYRDCLTLLEQLFSQSKKITADDVRQRLGLVTEPLMWQLLYQTFAGQRAEMFQTYQKFVTQGTDWKYLLTSLLHKLKSILFFTIAPEVVLSELVGEEKKQVERITLVAGEEDVVRLINLVLRAESELRFASIQEVPLGAAIAEYGVGAESRRYKVESGGEVNQKSNIKNQNDSVKIENNNTTSEPGLAPNPYTPKQSAIDQSHITNHVSQNDTTVSITEEQWNAVIAQVQKVNSTLAGLLKQSKSYIVGSKILIEVPYKLWEDKVKSAKNSIIICEVARSVVNNDIRGVDARCNAMLRESVSANHKKADEKLVDDVKEVFG